MNFFLTSLTILSFVSTAFAQQPQILNSLFKIKGAKFSSENLTILFQNSEDDPMQRDGGTLCLNGKGSKGCSDQGCNWGPFFEKDPTPSFGRILDIPKIGKVRERSSGSELLVYSKSGQLLKREDYYLLYKDDIDEVANKPARGFAHFCEGSETKMWMDGVEFTIDTAAKTLKIGKDSFSYANPIAIEVNKAGKAYLKK